MRLLTIVATSLYFFESHAEFTNYQSADLVLGQVDFMSSTPALTQTGLGLPNDVAIDPATGKVFVVEFDNCRVLRYGSSASLTNGAAAEAVLGQDDFVSLETLLQSNRMRHPAGICVDAAGRLWVADQFNHRVLRFDNAATRLNGASADAVLGQMTFTTGIQSTGDTGMAFPADVVADSLGNLWVSDQINQRVLCFVDAASKANGAAADKVFGQPDFMTTMPGISDIKFENPNKLAISAAGVLWVADTINSRVLRFDNAINKVSGMAAADCVLGQNDFTSNSNGTTAAKFSFPSGVALDASGTLYVGDDGNHRVIYFKNAAMKSNGAAADGVLGQPDFSTNDFAVTINGMSHIQGLALDPAGRLYVAQDSNRVTRYNPVPSVPPASLNEPATISIIGKKTPVISKSTYTLKGIASSAAGVMKVQYRLGSKGAFKSAQGTTSWRIKLRDLKLGINKVTIRITASNGKVTSQTVKIKRTS